MTLIIAIKGKDYIIVGADSRSVTCDAITNTRFVSDIDTKLVQLNDHVCVMIAGDSERGTHLIEKFKEMVKPGQDVSEVVEEFSNFCYRESRKIIEFVPIESRNYPHVSFIIAGMRKVRRKYSMPKIYTIRSMSGFSVGQDNNYSIMGQDTISSYLFAKKYPKIKTWEDCIRLIVRCLSDTESIDGDVGGKKTIALINREGFKPQDVTEIESEIQNAGIKNIIDD